MLIIISILLIFGGIGSLFEALIAGGIRTLTPGLPMRSGHHYVRSGVRMILSGIILFAICL